MTQPGDTAAVAVDELLWRRVPWGRQTDSAAHACGRRPNSDAFRCRSDEDGLSVERALFVEGGPQALIDDEPEADDSWGVVEMVVGQVRDLGFDVVPDLGRSPSHALIVPAISTSGQAKRLAGTATWVKDPVRPPGGMR